MTFWYFIINPFALLQGGKELAWAPCGGWGLSSKQLYSTLPSSFGRKTTHPCQNTKIVEEKISSFSLEGTLRSPSSLHSFDISFLKTVDVLANCFPVHTHFIYMTLQEGGFAVPASPGSDKKRWASGLPQLGSVENGTGIHVFWIPRPVFHTLTLSSGLCFPVDHLELN